MATIALTNNFDLPANVSANLKRLMAIYEINLTDMAEELRIQRLKLQRLKDGVVKKPKDKILIPVANFFSISLEQLKGIQPIYWENINGVLKFTSGMRLPVYQLPLIIDNFKQEVIDGVKTTILTECNISKNSFAFSVRNTKLGLLFSSGSIVVCDKERKPAHELFSLIQFANENELVLRKILFDNSEIYIQSPNPLIKDVVKLFKNDKIFATVTEIKTKF